MLMLQLVASIRGGATTGVATGVAAAAPRAPTSTGIGLGGVDDTLGPDHRLVHDAAAVTVAPAAAIAAAVAAAAASAASATVASKASAAATGQ